jgi:DHA2 family multidrug resistance protein-like MFS transporter
MTARVLTGLGGAGPIVMAFSVLTVLFGKAERPKAVGVMSGVTFVAFPIGPILGGWLLSSYWWGWVFLINVPVVVVGLAAVIALVPESRAAPRHDQPGSRGGDPGEVEARWPASSPGSAG